MYTKKLFKKHVTGLGWALALSCAMTGSANASVSYTFNDLNNAQIDSRVGTLFSLSDEQFDITNNTGSTWTDFHMSLIGYGPFGYDFMRFADLGSDGTIYTGPGTASFSDLNSDALGFDDAIDIVGLNILNGQTFSFQVDIFGGAFPEGLSSFDIYANPTVDSGGTVPEPHIAVLLGIGLAGMFLTRRKSK